MKAIIRITLLLICLASCRKPNRTNPDMLGLWIHYSGGGTYEKFYINHKGKGYYYFYHSLEDVNTDKHPWLVIADELHFKRRKPVIFKINELPRFAEQDILFKFDTIGKGSTYMKLNQNYFKKLK